MDDSRPVLRYRFGTFEAEMASGELRRQGIRIKLSAQPFQVLALLLSRPGELFTREQISRELWPEGTFVDYEQGVNSAVNRVREALGDTAGNPRFVETMARRGYRFVAPVQRIGHEPEPAAGVPANSPSGTVSGPVATDAVVEEDFLSGFLASREELPEASHRVVETLFVLLQGMYVAFYVGALANLAEIEELMAPLTYATALFNLMIATAAILIPVRAFMLSAVFFRPPGGRRKILRVWRYLFPLDMLWALSPFLLLHHINFGLALACTALLVYSPFAQRSLVLMGTGWERRRSQAEP